MNRFTATLCAATLLASFGAQAENRGFYVGAGAGMSRITTDFSDLGLLPANPLGNDLDGDEFKDGDLGFNLFGGYRFGRFFAIEAGYLDLGEADETQCFLDPENLSICSNRSWTVTIPIEGYTLTVMGILPLGDAVDLYLRTGAYIWDADAEGIDKAGTLAVNPDDPGSPPVFADLDDENILVGFGAQYNSDSSFSLRAEWMWLDLAKFDSAWTINLSAIYDF